MFRFLFMLTALLALAGCGPSTGQTKGKPPQGDIRTILAVKAGDTPPNVTLRGVLIEKCPAAGCWFRLQDETGVIKVDTKAAGFVVLDVPLKTPLTVGGKVRWEGTEAILDATGIRH